MRSEFTFWNAAALWNRGATMICCRAQVSITLCGGSRLARALHNRPASFRSGRFERALVQTPVRTERRLALLQRVAAMDQAASAAFQSSDGVHFRCPNL